MTMLAPNPRAEQEPFSVLLEASLSAASRARHVVGDVRELRRLPDLAFIAQLLTSELVSNVLRHAGLRAGEAFRLDVDCDDTRLRVEVADPGPGFDPLSLLAARTLFGIRHKGLSLVDALADRWGFRRTPHEFLVWYELDLVPGRRAWIGRLPAGSASEG